MIQHMERMIQNIKQNLDINDKQIITLLRKAKT